MSENKSETDTSTLAAAQAALVAQAAAAAAASSAAALSSVRDSPNRKKPKVANPVVHLSQFLASVNAPHGPQPQEPTANQTAIPQPVSSQPMKITYAGIAMATPKQPAAKAATPPAAEPISLCLKAMLTGAKMLRTTNTAPPVIPADRTSALPALGILVKS